VRRLWGDGSGSFRSRGRYSSATVRGTVWLTEDYCNGTLIKVQEGAVTVRDLVKNKTVTVTAGKSYFAEVPAPKAAKAKAKKKTAKKRKPAGGR
jgi:ferric-dicitrate binding protein FerR (iron transport regulator)